MADVLCVQKAQSQPLVCQPMSFYRDVEMTQKVVICYLCRLEQPGGEAAVQAFYDQFTPKDTV